MATQLEAWQSVPEVTDVVERAPRGTWSSAALICNYFSIEYRTQKQVAWRAPAHRPARLRNLRRRLALARAQWGAIDTSVLTDRPGAGQPLTGPLALPEPRPARPSPVRILPLRDPYFPDPDMYSRSWATWYLRTGLVSRPPLQPFPAANILTGRGI
jgi:hypothetical protein